MATYYSDEFAMLRELKKYYTEGSNALEEEDIERARSRADQKVNAKLIDIEIPDVIPDAIKEAATLFAVARALDMLFAEQDNRSPLAVQNDKDAYELLDGYLAENPEQEAGVKIGIFTLTGLVNNPEE
jgi:hypothetical protein